MKLPDRLTLIVKPKVSFKELVEFTRLLSVMLKSRVPLLLSLKTLSKQSGIKLARVLNSLIRNLELGKSFSECLSKYPDIFSLHYVKMIEVGENTGTLWKVLQKQSDYLEKIHQVRSKVFLALLYPSIIVLVSIAAIIFVITFIVPAFADIFAEFNAELPYVTKLLLQISQYIGYTVALLVILILLLIMLFKTKKALMNNIIGNLVSKLPFIGTILEKNNMAQFCYTLGNLLQSGVNISDALSITQASISNPEIKAKLSKVRKKVIKGKGLAYSLKVAGIFPEIIYQMTSVGEETAKTDEVLLHLAELYNDELESLVDTLTTLIEPVIITVLGIVIGSILILLYLPMFDLFTKIY